MERTVRLTYEDNAKAGQWEWCAVVTVRTRGALDEFEGYGHTPAEALSDLAQNLENR